MNSIAALAFVVAMLGAGAAVAGQGKPTCEADQRMTGTVVTECRRPERKPTHCTTYTNINGTTKTECR